MPTSALQRRRRIVDGGANTVIGRAAADIAVHRKIDVPVARLLDLPEQRHSAHDLAGLAIAALRDVARDPCFLHRIGFHAADAFDRRHLAVTNSPNTDRAGSYGLPL